MLLHMFESGHEHVISTVVFENWMYCTCAVLPDNGRNADVNENIVYPMQHPKEEKVRYSSTWVGTATNRMTVGY